MDCRVIHSFPRHPSSRYTFTPRNTTLDFIPTQMLKSILHVHPLSTETWVPYQFLRWSYKFHTASYRFWIWFFDWPNTTQFSNSVAAQWSWFNLNDGIQKYRSLLQSHTQQNNSVKGWAFVPGAAFSIQSNSYITFVTVYTGFTAKLPSVVHGWLQQRPVWCGIGYPTDNNTSVAINYCILKLTRKGSSCQV